MCLRRAGSSSWVLRISDTSTSIHSVWLLVVTFSPS